MRKKNSPGRNCCRCLYTFKAKGCNGLYLEYFTVTLTMGTTTLTATSGPISSLISPGTATLNLSPGTWSRTVTNPKFQTFTDTLTVPSPCVPVTSEVQLQLYPAVGSPPVPPYICTPDCASPMANQVFSPNPAQTGTQTGSGFLNYVPNSVRLNGPSSPLTPGPGWVAYFQDSAWFNGGPYMVTNRFSGGVWSAIEIPLGSKTCGQFPFFHYPPIVTPSGYITRDFQIS